jgi:hypothetical protein
MYALTIYDGVMDCVPTRTEVILAMLDGESAMEYFCTLRVLLLAGF